MKPGSANDDITTCIIITSFQVLGRCQREEVHRLSNLSLCHYEYLGGEVLKESQFEPANQHRSRNIGRAGQTEALSQDHQPGVWGCKGVAGICSIPIGELIHAYEHPAALLQGWAT